MRAIVFKYGGAFTGIAFEGQDAYDRNVQQAGEGSIPILIPADLSPEDVLFSLNNKVRRILKSGQTVDVDGVKVVHRKLGK